MVNDNIISDDTELAQIFNNFLKNVVKVLKIDQSSEYEESTIGITDPVEVALNKFKIQPSKIKEVL